MTIKKKLSNWIKRTSCYKRFGRPDIYNELDKEENNNPENRKQILDAASHEIDKMMYCNLGRYHYRIVVISMWYGLILSFLIPFSGLVDDENDNISYLVAYILLNILNVVMLVLELQSICQRRK